MVFDDFWFPFGCKPREWYRAAESVGDLVGVAEREAEAAQPHRVFLVVDRVAALTHLREIV